mgnify:CR=1 FL=1
MSVSVLLNKIKSEHDNYILIDDAIELIASAIKCPRKHVITYLEYSEINEHLQIFYMDENLGFYPADCYIPLTGEDTYTLYFQRKDLAEFEPLIEHNIFANERRYHYIAKTLIDGYDIGETIIGMQPDRARFLFTQGDIEKVLTEPPMNPPMNNYLNPPVLIHDVYGRTYDINQHKKNREDDYLTLGETLDFLNYNNDVNSLIYDHVKLRDLARRKLITPCFYFDGYVGSFRGESDKALYTEIITGYFTYRLLTEEICRYDDYMKLPNDGVMIYSILEKRTAEYVDYDDVFLFHDKPQGLDEAEKSKATYVEAEEIRFSKRALHSYIASLANTSPDDTPAQNDSELLAKLEKLQAKNDDLDARLSTARDNYRQNQNEIKELKTQLEKSDADYAAFKEQLSNKIDAPADESMLQIILDESHEDHAPDLKHAIQLWIDLYIHCGIKGDSHSSKANIWIKKNTNYVDNAISSIGRIREIATPFKDFGAKRSREEEK